MEKMRLETPDMMAVNVDKIGALFPNCITETADENGNLKKAINFDLLRQMLSGEVVEGDEAYEFTWVGKKAAIVEANKPIRKTLRPCPEESVDWDATENLYIEGDNLDVLKLLQESYLGKIKIIYIDPPYNTGNDFIYRDNFDVDSDKYEQELGLYDEESGNRFFKNTDSNGRFHSDWCSMIFARLLLARNLLSDDGIIMISIGEDELDNLHKICNEIFGEPNEISIFTRVMKSGGAKGQFYTPNIDYVLIYAKAKQLAENFRAEFSIEQIERFYNRTETEGERKGEKYGIERIYKASLDARPNQRYYIECPDGELVIPPGIHFPSEKCEGIKVIPNSEDHVWKWTYERYKKEKELDNIVFIRSDQTALVNPEGQKAKWNIYNKLWLSEQQEKGVVPGNFIPNYENRQSSAELKKLGIPFDYAKPTKLLKYLLTMCSRKNDYYVLDFFSGSSSLADAVMQLNASDSGHRKYIMIQIPELCDEKSAEYKAGFMNICEIGKERIRRAGAKIKEDSPLTTQNLDTGFRVFKLDESNMNDVYYAAGDYTQGLLAMLESNVKQDRTDLDLLFGCLLEWGLPLSMPYMSEKIDGCAVHTYNDGDLIACFDENIPDTVIKAIARRQPLRAVFRDSSFSSSPAKINVGEIFKMLAPDTRVKVI